MPTRSRLSPSRRPAAFRTLVCAVPGCGTVAGDAVFCTDHKAKIGKQRLLRVFLWRDRLWSSREREGPNYEILKHRFEYAVKSACQQAAGNATGTDA